jgi:DsbC/DsbD-like thiol-disulfide interchange protein
MNPISPFVWHAQNRSVVTRRQDRIVTGSALVATLVLICFFLTASSHAAPAPQTNDVLQPQAYVSLQPVPRDHAFEIAVVGKITPGFHVNAHQPSEDYLIPTKITADLPPGILVVETTYPRGVMRGFSFTKEQLRVYEGSFTVRMKLRAQSSARIGKQKIALTINYQACNQDSCLPPTKVSTAVELEVADSDTPAHPVNANIFSGKPEASPAIKFPTHP